MDHSKHTENNDTFNKGIKILSLFSVSQGIDSRNKFCKHRMKVVGRIGWEIILAQQP